MGFKIPFVVLLATLSAIFPLGSSQFQAVVRGNLPDAQFATSAVYDGDNSIYILGGVSLLGGYLDQVLRYDLTTEQIESVGRLLVPVAYATAQIDNQGNVFHFAGVLFDYTEAVFKFSTTDELPIRPGLVERLPAARADVSSGYDGQDGFYVFGGMTQNRQPTRDIFKFNSTTNEAEHVGILPGFRFSTGATWFQDSFFVFGGSRIYGYNPAPEIFKYTPGVEDGIETLDVQLQSDFISGSAVTVGEVIYLVGGQQSNPDGAHITRFDPVAQTLENVDVTNLPEGMNQISSVYVPRLNRIYVIGGYRGSSSVTDEIISIDL